MNSVIAVSNYPTTEVPTRSRSMICTVDGGTVNIDYPRKEAKEIYGLLGVPVPVSLGISELRKGSV